MGAREVGLYFVFRVKFCAKFCVKFLCDVYVCLGREYICSILHIRLVRRTAVRFLLTCCRGRASTLAMLLVCSEMLWGLRERLVILSEKTAPPGPLFTFFAVVSWFLRRASKEPGQVLCAGF